MSMTAKARESIVKLVPGGGQTFAHLSGAELLTHTRRLVKLRMSETLPPGVRVPRAS